MTIAVDCLLAFGVACAWLGMLALVRLRTPLQRLHAVTFINIAAGAPIVLAAFCTDGITSRALKCAFVYATVAITGALLAQVTGRAAHLHDGARR